MARVLTAFFILLINGGLLSAGVREDVKDALASNASTDKAALHSLMQATQAAAADIESLRFEFSYEHKFMGYEDTNRYHGSCLLRRAPHDSAFEYHFRMDYRHNGARVEFVYDGGDTLFAIFHDKQKAFYMSPLRDNIEYTNMEANSFALKKELLLGMTQENNAHDLTGFALSENSKTGDINILLQNAGSFGGAGSHIYSRLIYDAERRLKVFEEFYDLGSTTQYTILQIHDMELNPAGDIDAEISDYSIPDDYEILDFIDFHKRKRPVIEPLTVGSQAPPLQASLLSGADFKLAPGPGTVYLLDFWYINCAPCQLAVPTLKDLHREFGGLGLQIVGVNRTDNKEGGHERMRRYVEKHDIAWPQVLSNSALDSSFGARSYPTFCLIDEQGAVRWFCNGFSAEAMAELRAEVTALLKPEEEE